MTTTSTQAEADGVLFTLLMTPEGRGNPLPLYHQLRELAPVHRSGLGLWAVSRYDDCQHVLRDPKFGKQIDNVMRPEAAGWPTKPSMLFLNPPDHTRLRGLVARAFTPRTVEALRPSVQQLTDDLLDRMAEAGEVDVMETLAFPLPVAVIGELVGVPPADRHQFQRLVRAGTAALEPVVPDDVLARAVEAQKEMHGYFRGLVAERRAQPADDLLSELIGVSDGTDSLDEEEVISTAILLFAAGFETTTNLIGNGLLALLRHPDELARLRDDPSLLRTAVDELLRFDGPVQLDGRTAMVDAEVAGHPIPAGEQVVTLLGAANHDPERFPDPDRLDVGRDGSASMSFGSGIHYCLGAALARLEGQVVFDSLLRRFGSIELSEEPEWRPTLTLRGLLSLRVALRP